MALVFLIKSVEYNLSHFKQHFFCSPHLISSHFKQQSSNLEQQLCLERLLAASHTYVFKDTIGDEIYINYLLKVLLVILITFHIHS